MGKKGRPAKFVFDETGKPIVGLSIDKKNGSYYATYSKPRQHFGSDYARAVFEYYRFSNQQKAQQPHVEIDIPYTANKNTGGFVKWAEVELDPVVPAAYEGDIALIPEVLFLKYTRQLILSDSIQAARKLGIPELARLRDLPKLEPPLPLTAVGDFYIKHRQPSVEETRKCKNAWKEFCKHIEPAIYIGDISRTDIIRYYNALWSSYKEKNYSGTWITSKFQRVKTILRYYTQRGSSNFEDIKRVLDFCSCLKGVRKQVQGARPMSREDFHKLLNVADKKWRAILLLGLNCAYYAKSIEKIEKRHIKTKGQLTFVDFRRTKNNNCRINVLWKETVDAINDYLTEEPHNSDVLFLNHLGDPFRAQQIIRIFQRVRKDAGLSSEVKFNNLRDAAASSLFSKVPDDLLRITLGHQIRGEKSKYILVNPEQVKVCSEIIHAAYMAEDDSIRAV